VRSQVTPGEDTARWLRRFRRGGPAEARLFCFHHAGGTASIYREWPRLMPPGIEPVAVQLPGRADRFREPPFDSMSSLVDALAHVIEPMLDRPYAFYGLSMGAKLAWTLTHRLGERALPLPGVLFLASVAAPDWGEGRAQWDLSEDQLVGYLREMGGTPPEVLAEPTLLAFMLPTLRADLALVDSFQYRPARPLDVPIRAFAGTGDIEGPPERMRGWGRETTGRFDLDVVSGGHFFDPDGELQVIRTIAADMGRELAAVPIVDVDMKRSAHHA
jgi:medium-chain acyl-[acyl-carrier-protein] hydrolase